MTEYEETSLAAVFLNQVEKYGDRACVARKEGGQYSDISWNRMGRMVRDLASFLILMGIGKGDHVALFSPNRFEWWVTDLAILATGAVDVPVYATNSTEEALDVLGHSRARACFVAGQEHLETVLQVKDKLPDLEFVVVYDPAHSDLDSVFSLQDAFEKGRSEYNGEEFDSILRSITPSDPATILYTSGTTAVPKGVILSHNNFITNVRQIRAVQGFLSEKDIFLSFLPLSHALERTAGYYLPVSLGAKVAFAEDFSKIQQNLTEVRPTVIISVPRLYEKIHAGILSKISEASRFKKALVTWAIKIASENLPHACGQKKMKGGFTIKYGLADRLVFSKLKAVLGMDKISLAVSGGGPLSVSDSEFFIGMGFMLLEGYGLTETAPVTNVNRPWLIKPGTVGPPLEDTTIKFSEDGEILIKGPQVMRGYYKDEAATQESFTDDGFFRTGDIGTSDEDGYLSITGRIKDIIITAGGKNISPQKIENSLNESRYIEQVCITGDRRKYLSALVVPAFNELIQWAKERAIVFKDNEELIQDARVLDLYEKEIGERTNQFARAEKIRKFKLLADVWSQKTSELTPTLKVKRRIVEEKHKELIDEMY
jgi:long-chain acyl-CoA synthetase